MRNNVLQYFFILLVIVLVVGAAFIIYKDKGETAENTVQETISENQFVNDLRFGIAEFDTINPLLSNNRNVQEIAKVIYEPLLRITADYKLENCLAVEYSKTGDETYIIKLREEVAWHDEGVVDSEDVKYTVDRLKNEASSSMYAENVRHIIQLEIIDKYTLKIVLDGNIPFFEYNLVFPILSAKQYSGKDFLTTEMNPAGTGMYKIADSNSSGIKLIQNKSYWQEKEYRIEEIKVILYGTVGELYNAFKLGNVDIMNCTITNIEEHIGTIGFNKKEYAGREYEFLAINTESQELAYQEIRQAINYAIDKSNIITSIFGESKVRSEFPLNYGNWLYNYEKERPTYNPDLAKQVLSDNGWEYKGSTWQKIINYRTGRTNFDLIVYSGNDAHVAIAEIIKQQLENIGMKITIRKVTENQYRNYINNKNYELIIIGITNGINPDLTTFFGEGNLAKFNNEEVSTLLDEVKEIKDKEALKEKYNKIADISFDQVPYIGLYRNKNTVVYSQKLSGEITPTWYNIFYNVNEWKRQK